MFSARDSGRASSLWASGRAISVRDRSVRDNGRVSSARDGGRANSTRDGGRTRSMRALAGAADNDSALSPAPLTGTASKLGAELVASNVVPSSSAGSGTGANNGTRLSSVNNAAGRDEPPASCSV